MFELPHVTVATVVERQGQFLMVRERSGLIEVYNQPAGHVEPGESLEAAALRETLEETGWEVRLTALLGIYQYTASNNGVSYVRVCYTAEAVRDTEAELDPDILGSEWMSQSEIDAVADRLRSPLVAQALADYQADIRYPLEVVNAKR